nr:uncharacterized protein CI109_003481 [Kwoniella shandongensis]KAA5528192.1 hypothetical protein CI109_003481 [Kwoniella shandongensis]
MKSFNIGAIDEGKRIQSGNNSTRSSGSFVSTVSSLDADGGGHEVQYGYESVTTRPSSSMFDDSSNDDDEEEEEDSDDEDDVVFVLHP